MTKSLGCPPRHDRRSEGSPFVADIPCIQLGPYRPEQLASSGQPEGDDDLLSGKVDDLPVQLHGCG